MKIEKPSFNDIRKHRLSLLAALALAAILLLLHFLWLKPVLKSVSDLESNVDKQSNRIAEFQEKLNQTESIRENLIREEEELKEMQKRLFRGNDPYQLAASLGELLSSKGGMKLDMKTYQVLASKEYGLYQEVHLRFNFMTTVEGLDFFLDRLKNFQAAILVQEMNIQKIQRKTGPDLVINVILSALMEKSEKT